MKFYPSYADADLWMRKTKDGFDYIAVYVDDLIVAARDPMSIMDEFKEVGRFKLKGVGEPEYYLGGDIERIAVNNGNQKMITKISARTCIMNVCDKILFYLAREVNDVRSTSKHTTTYYSLHT